MHIILGGTGHIGSALVKLLIERGESVTVVTRDERKRVEWEKRGAQVAVTDVGDVQALRRLFSSGRKAYLLNPPAPPPSDIDREERRTAQSIAAALKGSGLEHVVVQSTYGAQPGHNIGDLGTLYEFEQAVKSQEEVPVTVIRAAYYMSNWDMLMEGARTTGRLPSFFPAEFKLPMVAPEDIARLAAEVLTAGSADLGLHHIEGSARYSASDVATYCSEAFGTAVSVDVIPEAEWIGSFRAAGYSHKAAESMAAMTRITLRKAEFPELASRGETSLESYVRSVAKRTH